MKTIKLSLLAILIMSVAFVITSCETTKQVVQPQEPQAVIEQPAEKQPYDWVLKYFASIDLKKIKDSLLFYNSTELTWSVNGSQLVYFGSGEMNVNESSISRRVPKLTAGKLIDVQYVPGTKIVAKMIVSFDPQDKGYNVSFVRAPNDTYIVEGTTGVLKCKLVFYLNSITDPISNEAKGWQIM